MIPSDVPHESDEPVAELVTVWLEADTDEARRITPRGGGDIVPIPAALLRDVIPALRAAGRDLSDGVRAGTTLDRVLRTLCPDGRSGAMPTGDSRVVRARELLQRDPSGRLRLADVAASVGLSPSRLAHLLRPQLGLPFRRYALWLRLRTALLQMAEGRSITDAALIAGFADAPHLNRTFRRMLGFTPSALHGASTFVQDAIAPPRY